MYTIEQFQQDFSDEKTCFEWLLNDRFPNGIDCKNCEKVTTHHFIENRKSFSCQECGHHVHLTAGTIFYKSSTPLSSWFYAIFRIVQTQRAISAKQLQRELGVTYKTAWRMTTLIRGRLDSYYSGASSGE